MGLHLVAIFTGQSHISKLPVISQIFKGGTYIVTEIVPLQKSFSPDICILELVLSVLSYPAMTKGGSAFYEDLDNPNNGSIQAWYLIDGPSI